MNRPGLASLVERERAGGAELIGVDGHRHVDFCLGDTGAMFAT